MAIQWKSVAAIALGGGTITTLSVLFLLSAQSPGCACGVDAKGSHLRVLHRVQQAAYLEKGRFLNQAELEDFYGSPLSTLSQDAHSYQVELDDMGAIALGYAIPYDRNFYPQVGPFKGKAKLTYFSAVSGMTFNPQTEAFEGVICASLAPSDQPLPAPDYTDTGFVCSASSTLLKAYPY